ncbi:MAG TPA: hypothetical protein VHT53_11110 [Candidatus Elarobacter sp.]|nr:hypothetical protein [Candidatus Elarobacter sp.]
MTACWCCGAPAGARYCGECGAAIGAERHWQDGIYLGPRGAALHRRAPSEIRALMPLLLAPFAHLDAIPAATWRSIAVVALMGVTPLALVALLQRHEYGAYWAIGVYFATLWAIFFGAAFHSTGVRWRKSLFVYLGTSLVGMTLLGVALAMNVEAIRDPLVAARSAWIAIPASILFIGFPEELTKALVLFAVWRFWGVGLLRPFLFYGLLSGLGFGISEGIGYQAGPYLAAASKSGDYGGYYLESVLRLTSLPFFHAVWAGTAAFLIWFGARVPSARAGFIVLAIAVPATFHGLYDALSDRSMLLSLVVVGASIVLLGVYVASAGLFERWLGLEVEDPEPGVLAAPRATGV